MAKVASNLTFMLQRFQKIRKRSFLSTKMRGDALEERVAKLFRQRAALRVRTNVRLRDRFGNISESNYNNCNILLIHSYSP